MKVAVIGSGGREHTIAWALAKNPDVEKIICIPGNGGTALMKKAENYKPENSSLESIVDIVEKEKILWAVIGPEDPLAKGLADMLSARGVSVIGP
ncbi:MAG TPA: phosphoribosylamine--glycine ligase family protein, partial [Treponemataceae bacterium]|nr:phosphoribosylamine--glycine ligase family protein [Treponemataceae bacterium]